MAVTPLRWLVALVLCAAPAAAQDNWFIDPLNGSDGAAGTLNDPWRSITHAFTVAVDGDTVWLQSGIYGNAAVVAGGQETFPLGIPSGVSLRAAPGATPVLDVGDHSPGLQLPATIDGILIDRLQVIRAAPALANLSATDEWRELVVTDCVFDDVVDGVRGLVGLTSAAAVLRIEGCTFALTGVGNAVDLQLSGSARLADGGVRGCTIGNAAVGILGRTDGSAVLDSGFVVADNTVAVPDAAVGIRLQAGLAATAGSARISAPVRGNQLTGPGAGTAIGIDLDAQALAAGVASRIDSPLRFNLCEALATGTAATTTNDGAQVASITSAFFGNRYSGCTGTAVLLGEVLPNAAETNLAVVLGSEVVGANTFTGNAQDLDTGGAALTIDARRNFFPDGAPVVGTGTFDTSEQLADTLSGTVSGEVKSATAGTVDIAAAALVRFVDDAGAGPEQLTATIDGMAVAAATIASPLPGETVSMKLPALDEGSFTLTITNPGGQTGTFTIDVEALYDGCFVATAAHGDYDAGEVVELRRLRDQYLQVTPGGRAFIRWYYAEGPKAAAWIAERPWARGTARAALAAPVAVSHALTTWNPGQRFGLAVLLLGVALAAPRRRWPRRSCASA